MDKDDDETIAVQSLAMVDAMFDAAEEAIMSAKTVFVRPSTRTFAAEMRRALFQNESTASPRPSGIGPPSNGTPEERLGAVRELDTERIAALGRNVMIGMVQQWLESLDECPGDSDALDLVRQWARVAAEGSLDDEMLHSPLHLAVVQPPKVPPPAAVAMMSTDHLRAIVQAMAQSQVTPPSDDAA